MQDPYHTVELRLTVQAATADAAAQAAYRCVAGDPLEVTVGDVVTLTRQEALHVRFRAVQNPVRRVGDVTTVGALTIYHRARSVVIRGRVVRLTRKEFDVLCLLAAEPGRCYSKTELMLHLWGVADLYSRTVDSHVCRLRAKLGPDAIANSWGHGWRLDVEALAATALPPAQVAPAA